MEHFQPMQFGTRLWIYPSWVEAPNDGSVVLRLDPGLAFGTGTHPTTQLCLKTIERHLQPGTPLLDLGTGTAQIPIEFCRQSPKGEVVAVGAGKTLDNGTLSKPDVKAGDILAIVDTRQAQIAAKEATMKALGVGLGAVDWHDLEVVRTERGAPDGHDFGTRLESEATHPVGELSRQRIQRGDAGAFARSQIAQCVHRWPRDSDSRVRFA